MRCVEACDRGAIERRTVGGLRALAAGSGRIVVSSRAEAKAARQAADAAARSREAASKAADRRAALEASLARKTATASADGLVCWTLLDALAILAVLFASLVASRALLGSELVSVMPEAGRIAVRAIVLAGFDALALGVLAFLANRHGSGLWKAFGLGRLNVGWRHRLQSAVLVLGLLVITRLVSTLWGAAASAVGFEPPSASSLTAVFGRGGVGLALSVAMVVVVAPLAEELVFRGVVQRALAQRWGMWGGILSSAVLFAAYHGTAWTAVPLLALGVATGWLAWSRRSLWPAIALHATYNGVIVAAAFWLAR
jgi:membrane protease YdiL (CAAX protease family)